MTRMNLYLLKNLKQNETKHILLMFRNVYSDTNQYNFCTLESYVKLKHSQIYQRFRFSYEYYFIFLFQFFSFIQINFVVILWDAIFVKNFLNTLFRLMHSSKVFCTYIYFVTIVFL